MVLHNFQCSGILLIWIIVEQGPTVLAVGVGGGCFNILSLIYFLFLFLLSLFLCGRCPSID